MSDEATVRRILGEIQQAQQQQQNDIRTFTDPNVVYQSPPPIPVVINDNNNNNHVNQQNLWVTERLQKAVRWNWITQASVNMLKTDQERETLAISYEIQQEWYHDWNVVTRKFTARAFLMANGNPTRKTFYARLKETTIEPYPSILAFSHGGKSFFNRAVDPDSHDLRVNFYYDEEYPWAGYLIQTWWPQYGNTERYDIIRKNEFKARILHDEITDAGQIVREGGYDIKKKVEDSSGMFLLIGGSILAIAAVGSSAALVSAIKK